MPKQKDLSKTILDHKQIAKILPHRYPFLLVDRIVHIDEKNNEIIGQKNLTQNEEFFQGHFPGAPIMPGVFILEALAQTGGIFVHEKSKTDKIAVLLNIANAKFRKPVVPGDVLFLHVKALHISNRAGKVKGIAMVNHIAVAEAEISFALVSKSQL